METTSIYEIRRANLLRLLQGRGARTHLARALSVTQSHVSHLLRDPSQQFARVIHEDMARAIETADVDAAVEAKYVEALGGSHLDAADDLVRGKLVRFEPARDAAPKTSLIVAP